MKLKNVYLLFCVFGLVLPYSQFIPYLIESGFNIYEFFDLMFANRISSVFAWDVIISAIVLITFIVIESLRAGIKNYWLPIIATFTVGVSFGFPIFLYQRQLVIEKN